MKKLYMLLVFATFSACSSSTDCCTVIDTRVDIRYVDAQGNNWLSSQAITEKDITIYFLKDGQPEKIYRGNLDAPKMFHLEEGASGGKELHLFPSDYILQNMSVTLLEFPDKHVDTVTCYIETSKGNQICQQVWYNGESKWKKGQEARRFEVIK